MSEPTDPFQDLVRKARTGDPEALSSLARQYEAEVRIVARLRLGPALRPHLDSMDLVQSVHRSLLIGLRGNRYQFDSPAQLIALALTIVRRKAIRQWQRVRRQHRLSGSGADDATPADRLAALAAPQSDPAESARYRDLLSAVWKQLDPLEQQVLELHLDGFRTVEIAVRLGLNADVLRVKLSRLRQRLQSAGVAADVS